MITQRIHESIGRAARFLQRFVNRFWYPPLIGFLAALDNLIVIIPNDGILISSSMLTPKRWFILAFSVAVGSTIGALILAVLVKNHGMSLIFDVYPGLSETRSWMLTLEFFERYGLYLVFLVAVTPFAQQPAVIMAGLASTPLRDLALVIFLGRLTKFILMAYIGSHMPRLLKKVWGIKGELKDVGVTLD